MASNGVLRVKRTVLSYYYYAQCRPSLASFSSSIERAKNFQARNAAAEATGGTSVATPAGTNTGAPDPTRHGMDHKAKQYHDDVDEDRCSGLTGYAAEMLKGGAEMAKDVADKVGETAKRTVDGAVRGGSAAMEQVKEVAGGGEEEKRGPNYRMDVRDDRERTVEDLRRRAAGYDTTK